MSDVKNMHNELNPHLQRMLAAYGSIPERDPDLARRTRARFMAELDKAFVEPSAQKPAARWVALTAWLSIFNFLKGGHIPAIGKRTVRYAFVTLIVVGVFLFSVVGITAYAASSSLPGDTLYSVKTTTEAVRIRLMPDDSAAQARLYLVFAGRRLVEIQALIQDERFDDIHQAASEFERDVQKSLGAVESFSLIQPAKAIALKGEMAIVFRGYSSVLSQMLGAIPGEVQPSLERAIRAANTAADLLDPPSSDDGRRSGRGGDDDCSAPRPETGDDDRCRSSSQGADDTPPSTPTPSSVPETRPTQSERDDDNGSSSGGGDEEEDDSNDDDNDDGGDDGGGGDDNDDGGDDDNGGDDDD
jgi:hypothetical protein